MSLWPLSPELRALVARYKARPTRKQVRAALKRQALERAERNWRQYGQVRPAAHDPPPIPLEGVS